MVVRSFVAEYEEEVIKHMESFGDLEDIDIPDRTRGKAITAYFTYKKRRDAEQVDFGYGLSWLSPSVCLRRVMNLFRFQRILQCFAL